MMLFLSDCIKNFDDKFGPFFSLLNLSRRLNKNDDVFVNMQAFYKMKSTEKSKRNMPNPKGTQHLPFDYMLIYL